MEIILLPNSPRTHRRVHLGSGAAMMLLVGAIAGAGALFYSGLHLGRVAAPRAAPAEEPRVVDHQRARRDEVAEAIRSAENDLDALTMRLGVMQAQLIRLDALGTRLVNLADLDEEEFDFKSPPAQGGIEHSTAGGAPDTSDFLAALRELAARIDDRTPKLRAVESLLMNRRLQSEVMPAGRPARGGWVSSFYGYRNDPITGRRAFHDGIDYAGRSGTEVVAVAAGVVTWAGSKSGYGRLVEIEHGNGYVTRYAHNRKNLVQLGDIVRKGQPIALMGSTGRSTGPHVHFEVLLNGKAVNPLKYVRSAG